MDERQLAACLTATESACLRYLLNYPEAELTQYDGQLVERLIHLGLIDRVLAMALPIIPQRVRYRLTETGRLVLRFCQSNS